MIELIHGDCLEKLKDIESGSIDLILTDPPYGTIKNISNENIDHGLNNSAEWDNVIDINKMFFLLNNVIKKNCKIILFAQQPYTTELITTAPNNMNYNYNLVWEKDHFANSLIAKKAPLNFYEDIVLFTKKHDVNDNHPLRPYFEKIYRFIGINKKQIIDKIGQSIDHSLRFNSSQFLLCTEETYNSLINIFDISDMDGFKTYNQLKDENKCINSTFNLWEGNKYKSNILKYKKDYENLHPTAKPVKLLEDLIKTYTNENETVLDFTMGSGSTGVACKNLNRRFIGIEKDDHYFQVAKSRIKNHSVQLEMEF